MSDTGWGFKEVKKTTITYSALPSTVVVLITWRCDYCGGKNDPKQFKCPNCGAPRTEK